MPCWSSSRGPAYSAGSRVNRRGFGDTETGGSNGIWHLFPNLDKYVGGLKEMVDVVGVDHVSIGTDQQAPGSAQDYSQWAQLVAAMLHGGFTSKRPVMPGAITCGSFVQRSAT